MAANKKPALVFYFLISLTLFIGSVSLIRSAHSQGIDFEVFWKAARYLIEGKSLYSVERDGGMVFKYPPWVATFFIPFGFLSLSLAKWIWGTINVFSLGLIIRWLTINYKINIQVWIPVLISYWGLWIVHALDNQVVLPMLATALYCWNSSSIFVTKINKGLFLLIFALSTKIFTLFPLLSLKWRKKSLIIILWIGLSFSFISIPAFWNEPRHSPIALLYSWNEAASSAGKALNPIEVRGRRNPSLPGLILRLAHVPPERSKADVLTAFMICALVALIWRKLSANFSARTSWLSWLAITPAIHPLPWWHLYILTFPLAMIVVNQSIKFKNRKALFLATLSIFLIGCSTETFLGQIGVFLEITLAKTWGTLLLLYSLLLLNKKTSF